MHDSMTRPQSVHSTLPLLASVATLHPWHSGHVVRKDWRTDPHDVHHSRSTILGLAQHIVVIVLYYLKRSSDMSEK
jgi:hypothetical protein